MANEYHEKDYDDEVYEDEYYEEHYDEEELVDDGDAVVEHSAADDDDEDEDELDDEEDDTTVDTYDWEEEKRVTVSFACEECDYRWDDVVIKRKDSLEEEEIEIICPMCGSMNVTQI